MEEWLSAPKDAGRVLVRLVEGHAYVWCRLDQVITMPAAVAVAPVKRPDAALDRVARRSLWSRFAGHWGSASPADAPVMRNVPYHGPWTVAEVSQIATAKPGFAQFSCQDESRNRASHPKPKLRSKKKEEASNFGLRSTRPSLSDSSRRDSRHCPGHL
jgi:hypothetical protein